MNRANQAIDTPKKGSKGKRKAAEALSDTEGSSSRFHPRETVQIIKHVTLGKSESASELATLFAELFDIYQRVSDLTARISDAFEDIVAGNGDNSA